MGGGEGPSTELIDPCVVLSVYVMWSKVLLSSILLRNLKFDLGFQTSFSHSFSILDLSDLFKIYGYQDTEIQGQKDTRIQRYKGRIHGYQVTRIQRNKDRMIYGYQDTEIQGPRRIYGYQGTRIQWYKDKRIQNTGTRVQGNRAVGYRYRLYGYRDNRAERYTDTSV